MDRKIYRTALDAAKRRFSPEFMNRIDKVVVFRTLSRDELRRILEIELAEVQHRIFASQPDRVFALRLTHNAKEFLLDQGVDLKYGARHLKRAIERLLVYPLSNLISTRQVNLGDCLTVDVSAAKTGLVFTKDAEGSDADSDLEVAWSHANG
jgi:ATP-dependent Clp protease ATP-binding subunit ClpA